MDKYLPYIGRLFPLATVAGLVWVALVTFWLLKHPRMTSFRKVVLGLCVQV